MSATIRPTQYANENTGRREGTHAPSGTTTHGRANEQRYARERTPSQAANPPLPSYQCGDGLLYGDGYVQTPTPEMGWHVAGDGQPPEPGLQIKAQYVG